MLRHKDHLPLGIAFVVALALHAALLPWVGEAVGPDPVPPAVDVEVVGLEAPSLAKAGETIEFYASTTQVVKGLAEDEARARATEREDTVWLSADSTLDENDQRLAAVDPAIAIRIDPSEGEGGAPRDLVVASVTLPDKTDGPYFLIYQADAGEQLPDPDRGNNQRVVPIFIDGPETPELAIEGFEPNKKAVAGGAMLVRFTVKNVGPGWAFHPSAIDSPTGTHWIDRVVLSDDDRLDDRDIVLRSFSRNAALGPEGSYFHDQVELRLPRGITGPMYLIAIADGTQVLDQQSFSKGIVAKRVELIDSSAPDLVVASIKDPQRLVIGRPTPVTFTIANLGSVPTVNADWSDGLYLSRNKELDEKAIPLTQVQAGQPLQPRARYESTVELTLPEDTEPGQWHLIVKADDSGSVDEQEFENNNTFSIPIMVLTQKQADAEIKLGDPDRPEKLVVQWIEHDRVEKHVARLSRTVQPALQDKAEPDPNAPLNFFPKPTSVANKQDKTPGDPSRPTNPADDPSNPDTRPKPTPTDATQTDVAPRPQDPSSKPPMKIDGIKGDGGDVNKNQDGITRPDLPNQNNKPDPTPADKLNPSPKPGKRPVKSPADPTAPDSDSKTDSLTPSKKQSKTDSKNPKDNENTASTDQNKKTDAEDPSKNPDAVKPSKQDGKADADKKDPDKKTTKKPDKKAVKPDGQQGKTGSPSDPASPTRVPKNDSEAPPTNNIIPEVALQEGGVIVGKGIKVVTKLPVGIGTGVKIFSLPRSTRISVTFNNKGQVVEAKLLKSTGDREWDQPIRSSLFNWSASGEAIDNAKPFVTIEWNYLLNELVDSIKDGKKKEKKK